MSIRYKGLFDQQGFTLLEMILVLMIMGMVASLSVVFIDNEDNQLRYEETIQKLETMHKATVTVKDYKDGFLLSGFVVDNGVLPSDAQNFVSIPEDNALGTWIKHGETYRDLTDPSKPVTKSRIPPYFRLTERDLLDNTPWPDGGYSRLPDLPDTPIHLRKGYLANYISFGVDSQGNYKDAWGDDFPITENVLDLAIDTSVKTTELVGFIGDTDNDGISDMNKNVPSSNWSIALTDISFEVVNETVTEVDIKDAIMGIMVFKNKYFERPSTFVNSEAEHCKECWVTYHFKQACDLEQTPPTKTSSPDITIMPNSPPVELICTAETATPTIFNCTKPSPTASINLFSANSTLKPIIWQTEALEKIEYDQDDCTLGHDDNIDRRTANGVRIPAGEHIVFVGVDESTPPDGKLDENEIKALAILKIIPRFDPSPTVTLVIE